MKQPHIIIFNPDHFRADALAHMGNPAAMTPNLDRLVESDAVSFRQAYCQAMVCTPSRCCFMSGWYPHVRGHRTMRHMLRGREGEPMLLKSLKDAGYHVWWGGKNDAVPRQDGFDDYCDEYYDYSQVPIRHIWKLDQVDQWRPKRGETGFYSLYAGKLDTDDGEVYFDQDWANLEGALEFIRNAPTGKPLCIYLPMEYPHPPFAVEEPWFSAIDRSAVPPRIPEPDDWSHKPKILKEWHDKLALGDYSLEQWQELRAVFLGMCARIDDQFGRVLDALRAAGLYDQSAVFFFSDHGTYLGDYGLVDLNQNTFDDVISNVPLVIKPPKGTAVAPRISDALVELTDFPATVEALAGLEPAHTHFGRSLLDVIAGRTEEHRDAVFAEGGRSAAETHAMETWSRNFSDPQTFLWPRLSSQADHVNHTRAAMLRTKRWKYVRRLYERDELYDLVNDPEERVNVVDTPANGETLAELRERMLSWFLETSDVVPFDLDER